MTARRGSSRCSSTIRCACCCPIRSATSCRTRCCSTPAAGWSAATGSRSTSRSAPAQAAEKVYRSAGPDSTVESRLAVGAGGWLEWLPQETILFDGARLVRRLSLDLAGDAHALAGEIVVFGRLARGERVTSGFLHDAWEIRRDDRLVWADALRLDDPEAALAAPAGFGGPTALGTLVYARPDAAALLGAARAALGPEPGAGASVVGDVLLLRLLSDAPHRLRRRFGAAWMSLRAAAGGLPPALPRLWHI